MDMTLLPIFKDMSEEEINKALSCSASKEQQYKKNSHLFHTNDIPAYLYLLLDGEVQICKDTPNGNRVIMNTIFLPGTTFGEVYLFLQDAPYDFYVIATKDSKVLSIPKQFFFHTCENSCLYHQKLIKNMLSILSEKAYFLNKKIQIISAGSLRQKLAQYFIQNSGDDGYVKSRYTREELADFLGVTRPSLSRELMKLKEEGIIAIEKKKIKILDFELLEL